MGLFDNELEVQVQATTFPFTKKLRENRLYTAVLSAINGNGSISGALLRSNLTGHGLNTTRYYEYGLNKYLFGLPSSAFTADDFRIDEVTAVLESIEGEPITVNTSYFYFTDIYTWIQWWLYQNEPNYDYTTNSLDIGGVPWKLKNYKLNENEYSPGYTVYFERNGVLTAYATKITDYPPYNQYYIVDYFLDSSPSINHLWLYSPTENLYPTLDDATISEAVDEFLPIVPLRINYSNVNRDKNSELYKDTKEILRTLRLNVDDLIEGATKTRNAENELVNVENLNKVTDIFVLYALNIYGNTQVEKKLLYEITERLEAFSLIDKATYESASSSSSENLPKNSFTVAASNYFYQLEYGYVEKTTINQYRGDVGTYYSSFDFATKSITVSLQTGGSEVTQYLIFDFRISHTVFAFGGNYRYNSTLENYSAGADRTESQDEMVIPITRSFLDNLTLREQDDLLPLCLHMTAYAADAQRVDWHESGALLDIISIVLKVFAFVSLVLDPSGSLGQFLLRLSLYIAANYAIEYILIKLYEWAGDNDFLRSLVTVAAVVTIYFAYVPGGNDLLFADIALTSVYAVTTVFNVRTRYDFGVLEEEYAEFENSKAEVEKKLQEQYDFLNTETLLDPSALLDTRNYRYEEPEDFYVRTLNTAPGQMTFDQLHNYVDNKLNLEYI